ncbi:Ig-like domain-containing protein [Pontiellaceae bacterium B12219]|nr:Ig-like domain-containing protein [Pontiellaceae bacterium B12219]
MLIFPLLGSFPVCSTAEAADYTWNGNAGDGDWMNAANWDGGSFPANLSSATAAEDMIVFDGDNMPTSNVAAFLPGYSQDAAAMLFNRGGTFSLDLSSSADGGPVASESRTFLTVGDGIGGGIGQVAVEVNNMATLLRHTSAALDYRVNSDGILRFNGNLMLYADNHKHATLTLDGGTVSVAGYLDSRFGNQPESGIQFLSEGSSFSAAYGGAFEDAAAVRADAAGIFMNRSGGDLRVTDHGASFTVLAVPSAEFDPKSAIFSIFDGLGAPPAWSNGILNRVTADEAWEPSADFLVNWDESIVFDTELQCRESGLDWDFRIGKGGQLYSIVFPGLGELVPPSSLEVSAWNDEVWQMTVVKNELLDNKYDEEMQGFGDANTHGSGMYYKPSLDPDIEAPLYCPRLAEEFDASNRTYSVLNIGLIPNPTVKRSEPLMYTQYRDMGRGVVEITYIIYNFGDYMYTQGSFPWGGLRMSRLPDQIRGIAGGGYEAWDYEFSDGGNYSIKDSGGWYARVQDRSDPASLATAYVHGLDQHYSEQMGMSSADPDRFQSSATVFVSGNTSHEGRDFGVLSQSTRFYLHPGKAFFRRVYLVMGSLADVQAASELLAGETDYGWVEVGEANARRLPLYETWMDGQAMLTHTAPTSNAVAVAESYATPVEGSQPLILMKDTESGTCFVTTDHYAASSRFKFHNAYAETNERYETYQDRVVYRMNDGRSEWLGLLGFVLPVDEEKLAGEWNRLSTVLGEDILFVPGEKRRADELMIWTGSPEPLNVNNAPEFSADVFTGATEEATVFNGTLFARDADGDTLTFEKVFGPDWLRVDADGTIYGTPAASDVGYTMWHVRVSDGNGGADSAILYVNITRSLSEALVGHWKFDDGSGTVAIDSSSRGWNGTVAGGNWVDGYDGGALAFDGSRSIVSLQPETFSSISNEITIALWACGDEALPGNNSIFRAEDAGGDRVLNVHLPFSDGNVYWDAGNGAGYDRIAKGAVESEYKGQWNHWVFTKNAATGNMDIYVNGTVWASASGKEQPMTGVVETAIGQQYPGIIDDVRIYNLALTGDEIAALYTDSQWVHIPEFTSDLSSSNGQFSVQFVGTPGKHYRFEYTDDLLGSNAWQVVTDIVSLATSPMDVSAPMTNGAGFYRVIWLPEE